MNCTNSYISVHTIANDSHHRGQMWWSRIEQQDQEAFTMRNMLRNAQMFYWNSYILGALTAEDEELMQHYIQDSEDIHEILPISGNFEYKFTRDFIQKITRQLKIILQKINGAIPPLSHLIQDGN